MNLIASVFDKPYRRRGVRDFLPGAQDQVWTWEADERVVAALIARRLALDDGGWAIAIGDVCTEPARRGAGYASMLVDSVCLHHAEKAAALAVLWAGQDLVGFYERLKFIAGDRDRYCEVRPSRSSSSSPALHAGALREFDHEPFEALRLRRRKPSISRAITKSKWDGVCGGFPWAPELSLVFGGEARAPAFYSVVGTGEGAATILEFVGTSQEFSMTVEWIASSWPGLPIRYNITSPELAEEIAMVETVSSIPSLWTLHRSLDGRAHAAPRATWLDRV